MAGKRNRKASAARSRNTAVSSRQLSGTRPELIKTRLLGGFADSEVVNLVYAQRFSLTSSALPAEYVFRGNGPYDPDLTGTGLQPSWYDTWTSVYNRYRVIRSSCLVTAVGITSSTAPTVTLHANSSLVSSTFQDSVARPRSKVAFASTSAGPPLRMSSSYSTAQVLGLSDAQAQASSEVQSLYNDVPTNQWYWVIEQNSMDGSTSVTAYYEVKIIYTIQFFDRVDPRLDLTAALDRLTRVVADRKAFLAQKGESKSDSKSESKGSVPAGPKSFSSFAREDYVEVERVHSHAATPRLGIVSGQPRGAGDAIPLQRRV